ncbi:MULTISPECIES: NADP-dependent oxidoreductase [unclassified Microbacterium]|uniref:NADP-dependent oxidoreductase n=1 Tax=unclassified Microbacterium TaxID=2609290 RepID=UPI00214ABF59|nr:MULTISPECIES: NADP-dependent oxidoreductase [unclassified Microbacterium]MCR2811397.1 NADP-dependent oxidoreductase [Microbacterium sp. zg.B185]WIM19557.1 NADP-dependent oxidoreductase [Microbacterium sp. zg-B185]
MKAIGFQKFGDSGVLEVIELPTPVAGAGELLVAVEATTVNPTDILMRSGAQAPIMVGLEPPFIAGMEFAGRVVGVGAGAPAILGKRVIGIVDKRRPSGGTHAQFLALPAKSVAVIDDALDPVEATTIPMNGLTALQALEHLGLSAGETLLVTGAPGALGGYVVQLARRLGILVFADASPADRELVERLGASRVLTRGPEMAQELRREVPGGVDGAVDAARVGEPVAELVRDSGVMVHVRAGDVVDDSRITRRSVAVASKTEDTAGLSALAAAALDGSVTLRVAERLPFERVADAHRLVEAGGLRGRVVLEWPAI